MTLLQLTALHFISAQAPIPLIELARALGTGSPDTAGRLQKVLNGMSPQARRHIIRRAQGRRTPIRRAAKGTPSSPVTSSLLAAFTERFIRNGQEEKLFSTR